MKHTSHHKKPVIQYKRVIVLMAFCVCLMQSSFVNAAAISSTATGGNWNATGSWTGGVIPGLGDDVTIAANASITVTDDRSCNSITFAAGTLTANRSLAINAGFTLSVTGAITMANPAANFARAIQVNGTLNCASLTMPTTGGNGQDLSLTIATTGVVTITGNLIMGGTFARNHVDMSGNAVINIGGNVGLDATPSATGGGFTAPPTTSTINLNGTSAQNVFLYGGASALGILKINNSAGVVNRATMTVTTLTIGDVTSNSIFDDNGFQVTSTGTLNLNNNSTFKLGTGTATTFPAFVTNNISAGTTVEYEATVAQTVSRTPSYSNLTITNGNTKTIGTGGALDINGNLTINTGATLSGATNNPAITLAGNYSNSGTFTSGSGLFTMDGTTNQSITGTALFAGGLTINNTGAANNNIVSLANNITTTGNLTITAGVFDLGAFTANRTAAGSTMTVSNGARLKIGGTNTLPSNYTTHSIGATSTIEYSGTTNSVIAPNSSQAYGNLVISASGATSSATFSVAGTMTVSGSFIASAGTVTMSAAASGINNSGTLTFFGLTINVTPTAQSQYNASYSVASTLTVPVGITFAPSGGTITMSGVGSTISNSGTLTFNNITIAATPTAQTQYNASYSVGGTLTVNGSVTFAPSGGTITMSSASSAISNSGTLTFNNITIATTPTAQTQYNTSYSVGGTLTVNGSVTFAPSGGTITMSSASSAISNSGTLTFNNITIATTPTAQTQYNTSYSVGGTLTVNGSVTFAPSGGTITMSSATSAISNSGTLTFNNITIAATPTAQTQYNTSYSVGGTLTVNGSVTFAPSGGTITMSAVGSTITNNGTLTFNNLTVSATPTAQSQYNTSFTVAGTLTISGAITFAPSGGTITMSGSSGSISNASGTVTFNNLTISGTTVSSTGNFAVASTMAVNGVFNPSATSVISGAGTLNGSGTINVTRITTTPSLAGQYTITNKTLTGLLVNYNGAGAQTVSAADYGSLTISTNGTRTVTFVSGGTVKVANVFSPTSTTTTYVVTSNTFEYNGAITQTIAAFTYNDLIVSNTGDKNVLTGTAVTCRTLTINDAAIVNIQGTGTLTATL